MKYFVAILSLLLSCGLKKTDEQALAKVKGEYLYPSAILGENYTPEDVNQISQNQIDEWINSELWYLTAKKELSNTQEIEEKVKKYEKDLYISAYKEKYAKENIINIGDDEIVKYFKANTDKYINLDDLYKVEYVKLGNKQANIDELMLSLNSSEENTLITEVCTQHPEDCMLSPVWVSENVLNTLNLPEYLWVTKVKYQTFYLPEDKVLLYKITEKRNKGELMPLELVSSEIISILEFQKTKKILEKKQKDLFLNAQKNNDIETYK